MGTKVTVDNVTNIEINSGVPTLNDNFDIVADEFDNVLYRDGSLSVSGDIDMDSNRLLNLPYPTNPLDALRLQDLSLVTDGEFLPLKQLLDAKVSVTTYNAAISGINVELVNLNADLATRATVTYVDTQLGTKADTSYVNTQLGLKADTSYVNTQLGLKANTSTLAASTGAATIGVSGGGTVADAIVAVTPEQFGAVGDGVADDTSALQAAVTFAGKGTLQLSKGKNYKVSSSINITQSLQVMGYGAKITTASHITGLNIASSGATVLGLELVGAGNGSFSTNGRLITVNGVDNGAATAPTYISKVVIRDCKFSNAGRCGVRAQFVRNLVVDNNDMVNIAYCGVEILSCLDVIVHKNFVKDVTPGTAGNGYGVYVSRANAADLVRYPIPERVSVCYNHIENSEWEGVDCHGGNDLDFSHNTLLNCGDTNAAVAIIHGDNESSTPIVPARNVRVIGNIIKGAQSFGIATSSGSATVIHENITISGNTLQNCGDSSFTTERCGLRIGAARNVSVTGNTFDYCAPYAIAINSQYASGVSIYANTFKRIVSNALTTPSLIRINRGASGTGYISIGGNTLVKANAGETYEAVRGVDVDSADGGNIRIEANNFAAATTKYVISLAQAANGSTAVVNYGQDNIAVTTGVSTVSKDITLPNSHSANTVYTATAVIFSTQAGNERTLVHCVRLSTTQIRVTVFTANGSNFPSNGNINIFWQTMGL